MLHELRIENFAIIDRLVLEFGAGLVTFTGETGAGKSIIIDAVETILGGRAEANLVRSGTERAVVEAVFAVPASTRQAVQAVLEREGLEDEGDFLTLSREVRTNGRNIARVNGRSASVSLLKELGELLIDVHGQSEHLSLMRVREHLGLLDRFAGCEAERNSYHEVYKQLQAVRRQIKELQRAESEAARLTDLLTYQINEIDTARLKPGEEDELKAERTRLANAEGLASLAQQALLAIDEGTPEAPAASDLLGQALNALSGLAKIDPALNELAEQAQEAFETFTELAAELRDYSENIEFNPRRLDQVEERLTLIQTLKRKYGESIEKVLEFGEQASLQLETITNAAERMEALQGEESALLVELAKRGMLLSGKRHSAAGQLKNQIESELNDLRMAGASFAVDFQQKPDPQGAPLENGERVVFDETGLERVEFLIAPNPGEGLKPLAKTASGGETSRLMLALKNVLARADHVPTLIFDEIDQGIGGRVGVVVGQKLWQLARYHQVLCITHLPQLAAFGDQHFLVRKQVEAGRTHTVVEPVNGEERVKELAQMFGELSEGTLHSAREMLQISGTLMQRVAAK